MSKTVPVAYSAAISRGDSRGCVSSVMPPPETARPSPGSKAQTFPDQASPADAESNVPGYDGPVTQGSRRVLLWARLRESTRAAHVQAEASLAPLAQPDSLARYATLLCVLWGFQAPLERSLGHQELPSAVGW